MSSPRRVRDCGGLGVAEQLPNANNNAPIEESQAASEWDDCNKTEGELIHCCRRLFLIHVL